ncbi:MAG: CHC2 zinc finger domain-containing protein [Anaerovoracaceae bacterium]
MNGGDKVTWEEIAEEIDIVEYVGQYVELKEENGEEWGCCPFHNEDTPSFSINPDNKRWYCFGCNAGGSIFDFIKLYHHVSFPDSVKIAEKYLGITESDYSPSLEITKELKRFKRTKKKVKEKPSIILANDYMDRFEKRAIPEWEKEFILPEIIEKHNIRYDVMSDIICIPIYNNGGQMINVKGRRMGNTWKINGMNKYMHYFPLPSCVDYFYDYSLNEEVIKAMGEVIVVEAEKSCLQLEGYGVYNAIAIGTSNITEEQLKTLIRLRVRVVLALDNDKRVRTMPDFQKLSRYCDVVVIEDDIHLLGEKDSPSDLGKDIWGILYDGRKKF